MLSKDLLQKVRLIEITTRKVIDDVVSGQYKSHLKGRAFNFLNIAPMSRVMM
jgi:hypothetical protein